MTGAATDEHPAHAEHDHPQVNYLAKFYMLVGLTITEVVIALQMSGTIMLLLLAALSLWKAAIVLNHFMHMKTENLALKLAMAFPVVLILVLFGLFTLDGYFLNYAAF